MRRLFWLALGAAAGAFAARRLTGFARAWTPGGIANHAAGIGAAVRDLAEEVRAAADMRESELRAALGLSDPAGGGDHAGPAGLAGPAARRDDTGRRSGRFPWDVDHSETDKDGR